MSNVNIDIIRNIIKEKYDVDINEVVAEFAMENGMYVVVINTAGHRGRQKSERGKIKELLDKKRKELEKMVKVNTLVSDGEKFYSIEVRTIRSGAKAFRINEYNNPSGMKVGDEKIVTLIKEIKELEKKLKALPKSKRGRKKKIKDTKEEG